MSLLIMESVSLVCDDVQMISVYLSIDMLKFPAVERQSLDYFPGGSPAGIQVPVAFAPLILEFSLAGWQPGVQRLAGRSRRFTARGLLRDEMNRQALQAMAVIEGEMTRVNPTPFAKGVKAGHEYQIQSITHCEVTADQRSVYLWDLFTCEFRMDEQLAV